MTFDTIAAIATAPGAGGISIVRISGSQAIEIASSLFRPRNRKVKLEERPSHSMTLGHILDGERLVDEVLVSIMRGPASYTGEDVVEINCHGGHLPARTVLGLLMARGCRLAEPGEFTRRAFFNGKLSLAQAEAILDVINARSREGLELAVSTLSGRAQEVLTGIEDGVIHLSALVEAAIDFPDEVGDPDDQEMLTLLTELETRITQLLMLAEKGRVYREGLKVVISGKPNVGKSSLLNLLLQENRVIVSDIPGTTRDVIEEYLDIKGIPVRIVDTAGIREAHDLIEKFGIERSRKAILEADLVILVVDVASGLTEEDLEIVKVIKQLEKNVIILINKEDLPQHKISREQMDELAALGPLVHASVKEDVGTDELENAIFDLTVGRGIETRDMTMLANLRQKAALQRALHSLHEVKQGVLSGVSLDCLAVDLMAARDAVGELTGKTIKEEIIDHIFSQFCIGK